MVAQKESKNMAEEKKTPLVITSETKIKQTVLNLDNGDEVSIEFPVQRFSVKKDANVDEAIREARKLLSGPQDLLTAILKYAEGQSYQNGRTAELAKGNFLTQELRSKIVGFMRQSPQFADLSAKEAFDKWRNGYKAGKPGAKKILAYVQEADTETFDL